MGVRCGRAVRFLRWAFAATLLLLFSTSIYIATLKVPFGIRIYGSESAWCGHTAAFHVVLVRGDAQDLLSAAEVTIGWRDFGSPQHITLSPEQPTLAVTLPVSNMCQKGTAVLDIEAKTPEGSANTSQTIHLRPTLNTALQGQYRSRQDLYDVRQLTEAPLPIVLFPTLGQWIFGMSNDARGRGPATSAIQCPALHIDAVTDAQGYFETTVVPPLPGPPTQCYISHNRQPIVVPLRSVARGLTLHSEHFLVEPGAELRTELISLSRSAFHQVDIWLGDLLVATQPTRSGKVVWKAPDDARGLARMSAYRDIVTPLPTLVALNFWIDTHDKAPLSLRHFLEPFGPLEGTLQSDRDNLVRLSQLTLTPQTPLLLQSTLESTQQDLEESKARWRTYIVRSYIVLMTCLVLGMASVVLHERRRLQQLHDVDLKWDIGNLIQLALPFVIAILMGAAILLLLTRLNW